MRQVMCRLTNKAAYNEALETLLKSHLSGFAGAFAG